MNIQRLRDVYNIRRVVCQGGAIFINKAKVINYFHSEEDVKKRADFLKKEYGLSGGACSGYMCFDFKPSEGVVIKRSDWTIVKKLTWIKLAQLIDAYILTDLYKAGMN